METENMSEAEMIDSEGPLYNELNDGRVSIDARLTPGIDPREFALVCQLLGNMNPIPFSCLCERIYAAEREFSQARAECAS